MMMWIIILALLIIGLVLIILELVFIPGTTVVGLLGVVFAGVGIAITYKHFGNDVGFYFLMGSLVVTGVAIYYSFQSGAWSAFSLKSSIDSKVNDGLTTSLYQGQEGVTVSTLRPIGKAEFDNKVYEVKTAGNYIEVQTKVKIVRVDAHGIIVEALSS